MPALVERTFRLPVAGLWLLWYWWESPWCWGQRLGCVFLAQWPHFVGASGGVGINDVREHAHKCFDAVELGKGVCSGNWWWDWRTGFEFWLFRFLGLCPQAAWLTALSLSFPHTVLQFPLQWCPGLGCECSSTDYTSKYLKIINQTKKTC